MIKKYTAMILILAIMISALPSSLFESVGYAATDVAEVNGTRYASLDLAIDAANGSTSPATIKLLGDIDVPQITPYASIANGLTIDLNGYTLKTNITVNREGGITSPTIKIFDSNASRPTKKLELTENGYEVSANGIKAVQGGVFDGNLDADGCFVELEDVIVIGNVSRFPLFDMDNATVIGDVSGGFSNQIEFGTIIGNVSDGMNTSSDKVEYKVGNEVFATQYIGSSSGNKPTKPIVNPTVDGGYSVCLWCSDEQLTVPYDFAGTAVPTTIYGKAVAAEAEVDGTLYEHLSDAINYARRDSKTVKLLKDNEYQTQINPRINFGVDLNGYVLKTGDRVDDPSVTPRNVKLIDSSPNAVHTLKKTENGYEADETGTVTVKGDILFGGLNLLGSHNFEMTGGTVIGDFHEKVFTIKGGTLKGNVTVDRSFSMSGGTVIGNITGNTQINGKKVEFMTDETTRWAIQVVADGAKATPPVFTPYDIPETWYKDVACTQVWDFESDTVTDDIKLYATKRAYISTAPTAVTGIVYDANQHELVNAGRVQNGTLMYSTDGTNYSADIPKKEDAGDYTVYYKVVGDAGAENIAPTSIPVKIEQAEVVEITPNPIKATVAAGAPLSTATFTDGKFYALDNTTVLGGTFAFTDPTKTNVQDNAVEECIFTPTNTNYKPKTAYATVTLTYSGGGGSGVTSIIKHTVTFDTDGGSEVESQTVIKDRRIEMPDDPTKAGYTFGGWYTDKSYKKEFTAYSKVNKDMTLYAKWISIGDETPSEDDENNDNQGVNPGDDSENDKPNTTPGNGGNSGSDVDKFNDVNKDDWYYEDVKYVFENKLMSGVSSTMFGSAMTLTRAMLVTILYREAGEPAVNKSIPFADVKADAYYANAVNWAQQNGIVYGVSENEFAPNEPVTREQIAAIMHRYAKYMGYDVSVGKDTNILSYTDFADISEYAIEALQYAVGAGLIKGRTVSTLCPKEKATRAEFAAILKRFIEYNK